jgi:hypothetical protein
MAGCARHKPDVTAGRRCGRMSAQARVCSHRRHWRGDYQRRHWGGNSLGSDWGRQKSSVIRARRIASSVGGKADMPRAI